jgi:pimeloyl-ACP methyl ester carboxylesterase
MTRLFAPPASWVMWLVLSVGTAASSAALASPSTQQSFEGTLASGARWRAEVPDHWNGTLLLFSHGYSPALRAPELAPPGMADRLMKEGYALAASAYSAPGWALAEAVPDQIATLDAFAEHFGKPKRTIAWGSSMGALVTVALAEQYPGRIDGAMPSCGSLAGSLGMMNEALDGAFAFKILLAADTDVRVVGVDDDVANGRHSGWAREIGSRECFGAAAAVVGCRCRPARCERR